MPRRKKDKPDASELRRQAEARAKRLESGDKSAPISHRQAQQLIHELQVHQIELEMQNEALREAQEEITRGLARYSDLYEFAPVGFLSLDSKGLIVEANLTASTILGISRSRLIGWRLSPLVSEASTFVLADYLDALWEHRKSESCEVLLSTATHELKCVRITGTVLESGDNPECRLALMDISESRRAEQELNESESRYRELFEQMTDGFARVALDGRITECNPAFLKLTGYTREELYHLTYRDITPPKWHEMERKIIEEQVLTRGSADLYEKEYVRKDGSIVPVELNTRCVRGKDKEIIGMSRCP